MRAANKIAVRIPRRFIDRNKGCATRLNTSGVGRIQRIDRSCRRRDAVLQYTSMLRGLGYLERRLRKTDPINTLRKATGVCVFELKGASGINCDRSDGCETSRA